MPKGFGYGGESANQERKNLLKDNPVARDASGGRPWIAKHFKSTMGSAIKMGHESPNEMGRSPNEMGHSPNEMKYGGGPEMGHESPVEKELVGNQKNLPDHLKKAIEAAPEMKEGMHMNYDGPKMKDGMHMNYDGVSKKYGAPTHKENTEPSEEQMKKAAEEAAKRAGEIGAFFAEVDKKNAPKKVKKKVKDLKK